MRDLQPLPRENVTYSFHTYDPMEVTHQGVFGRAKGVRYPGPVEVEVKKDGKVVGTKTEVWDRARLSRAIEPARAFARRTGRPVYVGEFGCVRWAPDGSAARWIADAASLFEKEGWAWTLHAWREWDGWSPEHGGDEAVKTPISGGTERLRLLSRLLAKSGG